RQNQQWGQTNECEVLEAIGPAARDAVPELVAVVEKGDYKAVYALRALAALRPTAADALPAARAGLRNRHFGVRGAALQLLGAVGPEAREALPEVREALGDPDAAVRMWAVYAGIRIEGSAAPYLTQLARELGPAAPGRGRSVFSAGEAFAWEIVPVLAPEAPEVVPVVLDWLRRSPPDLRRPAALRAVANYGPAARGPVSRNLG